MFCDELEGLKKRLALLTIRNQFNKKLRLILINLKIFQIHKCTFNEI